MSIIAVADSSTPAGTSALGLQDFMRILLTQLTYQDPLKPMDNQAFMAQMAQFTSLEQTQQLNDHMQQLIANQAALQSVGLIGRSVEVTTASGQTTGTVTALSLKGASPVLTISAAGGVVLNDVALSQVTSIR